MQNELEIRFQKAVEMAANMVQADIPQDVQLRLYAFYKHATSASPSRQSNVNDLRNAFKTNAWMQINHISIDDAKRGYIELIEELSNTTI
jgi:acyl-CoA-binding protein